MSKLKHFSAYVDFTNPRSLVDLASVLSESLFVEIPFVGLGEGIWDEVPAVRLERDFLGLRVELGGAPGESGGFTLQFEPVNFPWNRLGTVGATEASMDLSGYLRCLLENVDGVEFSDD